MYATIVVGTDGSERALDAVRRAGDMAKLCGVESIHLVSSCIPYREYELREIESELPEEYHEMISPRARARDHVLEAGVLLGKMGVKYTGHEMTGDAASAILDVAERVDADLIVVGARGLSAVQRFIRGSVSTRVAHHSPCDVLIVEHDD